MDSLQPQSAPAKQLWAGLFRSLGRAPLISLKSVINRSYDETVIVKASEIHRAAVVVLAVTIGIGMIALAIRPRPQIPLEAEWKKVIMPWLMPIGGGIGLCVGANYLLRRNELRIDTCRKVVRIRWGILPFANYIELPLSELRLVLFQLGKKEYGLTALGLELESDVRRVRIASRRWRSSLMPLFENLKPYFAKRVVDKTQVPPITTGKADEIVGTPISTILDRGSSRSIRIKGDTLHLSAWTPRLMLLQLLPILFALLVIWLDLLCGGFDTVIRWAMCLVFLGLVATVLYFHPHRLILRRQDWLQLSACSTENWPASTPHADNIIAVQICSALAEGEELHVIQYKLRDFKVYQINLVAKSPDICRVNLLSDTNLHRAQASAYQIAQFFDVPVLEHQH